MKVAILGASGYVGGELLRILLRHRKVEVVLVTSRTWAGEFVYRVHPNLRGETNLKFVSSDIEMIANKCEFVFMSVPHGISSKYVPQILRDGLRIVDAGADFRLKNPEDYPKWYGWQHICPELLKEAVYGLPELNRTKIEKAQLVAGPGCMAATALLALAPIIKNGAIEKNKIVIDFKVGSSGAGNKPSVYSHHPEHYSTVRPYKPTGHRHTAEIEQELGILGGEKVSVCMSAHAVNMVRGILGTCHLFLKEQISKREIWHLYRQFYESEPFVRFVSDRKGVFRYPDPKVVVGSNYCDLGFEIDEEHHRIVVLSALDNLVKGAAGTAVQNMNVMNGWNQREGLSDLGLHPV